MHARNPGGTLLQAGARTISSASAGRIRRFAWTTSPPYKAPTRHQAPGCDIITSASRRGALPPWRCKPAVNSACGGRVAGGCGQRTRGCTVSSRGAGVAQGLLLPHQLGPAVLTPA